MNEEPESVAIRLWRDRAQLRDAIDSLGGGSVAAAAPKPTTQPSEN